MTPKTIQIFLPSGDPRGLRVAEITTSIVRAIEVPRSLLADFLKMLEASQVGIYFLIGESEDEQRQNSLVWLWLAMRCPSFSFLPPRPSKTAQAC